MRQSHASGRLAHAYLVCGDPHGVGWEFAMQVARLVLYGDKEEGRCAFPDSDVEKHPDLVKLEPMGRGRIIDVKEVRALLVRMAKTSRMGGWKVCLFRHADCMNDESANAFLKTLEEPSPQSLFLLVTDLPSRLLVTIKSRCQRILLGAGSPIPSAEWVSELTDILAGGAAQGPLAALAQGSAFDSILKKVREKVQDEEELVAKAEEGGQEVFDARVALRVREAAMGVFSALLAWHRDVLLVATVGPDAPVHFANRLQDLVVLADEHTAASAQAQLEAVELATRRYSGNIRPLVVFERMCMEQGKSFQNLGKDPIGDVRNPS